MHRNYEGGFQLSFTKQLQPSSKGHPHKYYLSFLNKHPKTTNSRAKINEKFDDYILKNRAKTKCFTLQFKIVHV